MNLDIKGLLDVQDSLVPEAEAAMRKAASALTAATHAHIVEEAQQKLRSTREKFLDHLGFHQVNDHTWVVDLAPGAFFIEEGLPSNFDMIDGLLDDSPRPGTKGKPSTSKTKTAKDGSRYRVIPFEHSRPQTRQRAYSKDLTDTIKGELKRRGAPGLGTIETKSDGSPKLGLVRAMDIRNAPLKTGTGPGQGKGGVGQVRQGPTGIPLLQGVRIYQRQVTDAKTGKMSVKKTAMTFRVVSSKHKGEGRWRHPGLEAKHFLDEAYTWAFREWSERIEPEIMAEFLSKL